MSTRTNARLQRDRQQVLDKERQQQHQQQHQHQQHHPQQLQQQQKQQQKRAPGAQLIISSPSPYTLGGTTGLNNINGNNTLFANINGGDGGSGSINPLTIVNSGSSGSHRLENPTSYHIQQLTGRHSSGGQDDQHISLSAPINTMHNLLMSSSVPSTGGQTFGHNSGPGPGLGINSNAVRIRAMNQSHSMGGGHSHSLQQCLEAGEFSGFDLENTLSPQGYSPTDNSNASDVKSPIDSSFANILGDHPGDDIEWNQIEPSLTTSSTFSGAGVDLLTHLSKHGLGGAGAGPVKPSTSCPANMASPYPSRGGSLNVTPTNMSDDQRQAWARDRRKKDSHNEIERKRRDYINNQIAELGTLLPEELFRDPDCKKNKGSILKKTVEFICVMRREANAAKNLREETRLADVAIRKLYKRVQDYDQYLQERRVPVPNSQECLDSLQNWFACNQRNQPFHHEESRPSPVHEDMGQMGDGTPSSVGSGTTGRIRVHSLSSPVGGSRGSVGQSANQGQRSGDASGTLMTELLHADTPNEQDLAYIYSMSLGVKSEPPTPLDMEMDTGGGTGVTDLDPTPDDPVLGAALFNRGHQQTDPAEFHFGAPME